MWAGRKPRGGKSGGASRSVPGARGPQLRPVDAPGAAHADPDPLLLEVIVTEEFRVSVLPDGPRPRPEHLQSGAADPIGSSEQVEHRFSLGLDAPCIAEGKRLLQKRGAGLEVVGVGERHEPRTLPIRPSPLRT